MEKTKNPPEDRRTEKYSDQPLGHRDLRRYLLLCVAAGAEPPVPGFLDLPDRAAGGLYGGHADLHRQSAAPGQCDRAAQRRSRPTARCRCC